MAKRYTTFDNLPHGAIFTMLGVHPFSNYIFKKHCFPFVYCLSTKKLLRFNTEKLLKAYVQQL